MTSVMTIFAATVKADPAPADVGYTLSATSTSLTLALRDGSAAVVPGAVLIRNNARKEVFRMPLSYGMEYRSFPIDASVAGNHLTLTPSRDIARSRPLNPLEVEPMRVAADATAKNGPQTKQQRDDQALARFNSQLGAGMTISSLVGLTIGAIVGGVAGCVLGVVAGPFGCFLAGLPVGAGIGSIVGVILGGGGSLIVAGVQYFQTINSPFVPPQ